MLKVDVSDARKILQELMDFDGSGGNRRLSDWEVKFLEDLNSHRRRWALWQPSPRQYDKMRDIWTAVFS